MGKGEKMQQEYNICPNKLPHTILEESNSMLSMSGYMYVI